MTALVELLSSPLIGIGFPAIGTVLCAADWYVRRRS